MDQGKKLALLVLGIAAFMLAWTSMFTVKQWERAILFRFGEIVRTDYKPGLHFKIPFINNVRKYDGRVLTLDAEPERYLTAEKKNVIVDSFVKWKIDDVSAYYTALGGDALRANLRLSQVIKDGLRSEFGKRTIQEVVSGERSEIMNVLTVNAERQTAELGIKVIDVRIKRIDLSSDVSNSVFRRMEAERDRTAKELRSQGAEAAERIRADADRQRTVTLAEAYRDAEHIRGEGDAKASEIYAKAYNRDAEFYAFYRSINAYQSSFNNKADVMVLKPDADFFRYFNNMKSTSR
jgi:membrane protease subunit HflC